MAAHVKISDNFSSSSEDELDETQEDEVPKSNGKESDENDGSISDDSEGEDDSLDIGEEGESEDEGGLPDKNTADPKSGLADVMAKILKKKLPDSNKVILAKGKTDRQILRNKQEKAEREEDEGEPVEKKKKQDGTEDGENELEDTEKPKKKQSEFDKQREQRLKKKLWEAMGRIKPSVFDREKERKLQRTATKGVVQLFNAVKKQQKVLDDKLKQVGSSEIKRDKVAKTITKGSFLDMLKGTKTNISNEMPENEPNSKTKDAKKKQNNTAEPEEKDSNWSILKEDFMMGAKMKDWDKESDNEEEMDNEIGDQSSGDET